MNIEHRLNLPLEAAGRRLDQVLAELLPQYSRSRLGTWIKGGQARIDGKTVKPSQTVLGGESLVLLAEPERDQRVQPEALPIEVLYEDASLLVLNKPPGLVVHPGAGNPAGTLQNALLHRFPELAVVPRAGIIHRLDKDTSGLLLIARSLIAHHALVDALAARSIRREYLALVQGAMIAGGTVDAPLGRHPVDRLRQAVQPEGLGREAVTHYRVERRYAAHTLLHCKLETGRTHQIRVHLAHIGHPIVGDPLYGGRARLPAGASPTLREALTGFRRQALHAFRLGLEHPDSGEALQFEAPLPDDFAGLLNLLGP